MTSQAHPVLARRGAGGYRQYRIPALAVAGNVVLCAYDGRPDLDDLPAPIDLLLRRSPDGGRSWQPQQVVRSGTGFEGFGDPSLLVTTNNRVLLFHAAARRAGFFESGSGDDPADPDLQHCDLSVSSDLGCSWHHRRLTTQLRRSGNAHLRGERIAGLFAAAGAGCTITTGPFSGRLVQPFVLRIGGRIDVACALSDDHGDSWRLARPLGLHAPEAAELNESSVCMLPDGTLQLHSRGVGQRWATHSSDGGETFDTPALIPDLLDPGVNGSVMCADGILLASHCADAELRRNATISRSDDGGANWHTWQIVAAGSAGYTQLAHLPDGRIGIAYEADGYQYIRFATFDWRGGAAQADARQATSGTSDGWARATAPGMTLDLVLRSITPARPAHWHEVEPTHTIDLNAYADVDPAVFKEIGQTSAAQATQTLRTRASLAANLGPVRPGLRAGDTLHLQARMHNEAHQATHVYWDGGERCLAPQACWLRRDMTYTVSHADVNRGRACPSTRAAADGRELHATLSIPT